ncbi:anti-sigma factor family protein [Lacipirellula sp.]|uniref:anti-sigma factor family protein n=1 Tax=Lacipirellula sp. TaxID=2691419 RepID=UPI003D106936
MSQNQAQPDDELLEKFLDNLMNDDERASFSGALQENPARQAEAKLQQRIDDSLQRMFAITTPPTTNPIITPTLDAKSGERLASRPVGQWRRGAVVALAASLMIAAALTLAWQSARRGGLDVAARPLVDIYRNAVTSGFEPTYECHEPERFAATFERRQGEPLRLLELPANMRMLGLAYTGGLSRNATAMLAYVDDAPVMVFVDRSENDLQQAVQEAGGIHVFREERDGLVFYEVTPLESPRVTPFLARATENAP